MEHTALIVIDLQNDITKNYHDIIDRVNAAIDWAVYQQIPVIYIRHENTSAGTRNFKPGTRGFELVPELKVVSEHIFTKTKSSVLTCTDFTAFISSNKISDFYITGADAAGCVKSACYNLAKNGYHVTVLEDCITSYDKTKLPELTAYYETKGCRLTQSVSL